MSIPQYCVHLFLFLLFIHNSFLSTIYTWNTNKYCIMEATPPLNTNSHDVVLHEKYCIWKHILSDILLAQISIKGYKKDLVFKKKYWMTFWCKSIFVFSDSVIVFYDFPWQVLLECINCGTTLFQSIENIPVRYIEERKYIY